jgi:hypothetical protein
MGTIIVVIVAAIMLAPGALASPETIYKDLADNGRLDAAYTQAELEAYLRSASVQGYGNPVVSTPPPKANKPPKGSKPAGVAGAQSPSRSAAAKPARTPLQETAQAQTLPFTGAELSLLAIIGGALLLGGFALRASQRHR